MTDRSGGGPLLGKLHLRTGSRLALRMLWCLFGLAAVVVIPALVRAGGRIPTLPPPELTQYAAMAAGYLLCCLVIWAAAWRPQGIAPLWAILAPALCFGSPYLLLRLRPDVPVSTAVALCAAVVGTAFATAPLLSALGRAGAMTGAAAAAVALGFVIARRPAATAAHQRVLRTALVRINVGYYPGVIGPVAEEGGALAASGDGFLLVTGHGVFYRLTWAGAGDSLAAERLALTAPLDRDVFLRDLRDSTSPPRLRVTDLLIDTTAPGRIVVAHEFWHHDGRCYTLRVSATSLADGLANRPAHWTTLYDSQPCLPIDSQFDDYETGGRLAVDAGGRLLLTAGDFGHNGLVGPALAQDTTSDYGKVLRLDGRGGREILSIGHRNPEGLAVASNGAIWESEHGPQGGDEVNRIVAHGNYGWPWATYGTDYGTEEWPPAERAGHAHDHGPYREPAYVFIPAVAASNLIEVTGDRFPPWRGDLLLSSLGRSGLYRLRLRDSVVVYAEPIAIDRRIRDIEQGRDGRIVLWVDGGELIVLSPADTPPPGEAAFGQCAWCHDPATGSALGPTLAGVVGRQVASVPRFAYSRALTALGGRWTAARLDSFLTDPRRFAPGIRMKFPGMPDSARRRALIEYLRTRGN